jgi:hypothetical protein
LQVILDISRLLTSAQRASPTGIDRVELAYAKRWVHEPGLPCTFVAEVPLLGFSALPRAVVAELVATIEDSWAHGNRGAAMAARGPAWPPPSAAAR